MKPRATQSSEYNGFKNKDTSNNKTPMKIRNYEYEGGRLIKGVHDEDLLNGIVGLAGLPLLGFAGYKAYQALKKN